MTLLLYRDFGTEREFVGRIDYERYRHASFTYDGAFVSAGRSAGQFGISERLPLDESPYSEQEIRPFFTGLLPEGPVLDGLVNLYQIPRNDYLGLLEELGCESIGALTFVSEGADASAYEPHYDPLPPSAFSELQRDPVRAVTEQTSSTRLSLAGAQSKVAWFLPQGKEASEAGIDDWLVPRGTAASTHIIKIARRGEEDLALNEFACEKLARACGFETADVDLIPGLPGAIAVKRYDRVFAEKDGQPHVVRLHQEDFCQALGLPPYEKYEMKGDPGGHLDRIAGLFDATSEHPRADRLEFALRTAFQYAIGNADAHLKNSALLYNGTWTSRRLAPLYDLTCIPLTRYSTEMPFRIGGHRLLDEITVEDLVWIGEDLDAPFNALANGTLTMADAFGSDAASDLCRREAGPFAAEAERTLEAIIENARPRLERLRRFAEGILADERL